MGRARAAPIARQVIDYQLLGKVPTAPAKEGPDEEVPLRSAARASAGRRRSDAGQRGAGTAQ